MTVSASLSLTYLDRPTYKCTLPADDTPGGMADEQPLFQISKTNPQSPFWTLWYYAYAGRQLAEVMNAPSKADVGTLQI